MMTIRTCLLALLLTGPALAAQAQRGGDLEIAAPELPQLRQCAAHASGVLAGELGLGAGQAADVRRAFYQELLTLALLSSAGEAPARAAAPTTAREQEAVADLDQQLRRTLTAAQYAQYARGRASASQHGVVAAALKGLF